MAQVIYGVAAGTLEVGTFIPSVRDLAEQLPRASQHRRPRLSGAGARGRRRLPARPRHGSHAGQGPPPAGPNAKNWFAAASSRRCRKRLPASWSPDEIRRIVEEELAAVNGKRPPKEKR